MKLKNLTETGFNLYQNIVVFYEFLERLISYIPIIWKDRDYDYEYMYDLLEHKIKRMRKCYGRYGKIVLNHKKYVKEMGIVLAYFDRYKNADKNFLQYDKKYTRRQLLEHEQYIAFNRNMFFDKIKKWSSHWWF